MNEYTRIARLDHVTRERSNEGTQVSRINSPHWLDLRATFNARQRDMAASVAAQPRPGLFIFALGKNRRSHLWLQADEGVRAGIIGRHTKTDLALSDEDAMSLRHCVVVVTRDAHGGIRTWVSDLESEAGLRSEAREPVSSVESDGPFLLQVPGGVLVFIPSGQGLQWNPDDEDPFSTLPPRAIKSAVEPRGAFERINRGRHTDTSVHFSDGPASRRAPRRTLLEDEPMIGALEVSARNRVIEVPVGLTALERGLMFGRYDRCVGANLCDGNISRVHALLLARAGQLVILDTGSTNGVFRAGRQVRCEPIVPRTWYELAESASVRWTPRAVGHG